MQIISTLRLLLVGLFFPFYMFGQVSCTDYSEAILTGDTVCSNSSMAIVRVHNTISGKPYQAYVGTKAIGSPVVSDVTGSTITLSLPVSELTLGWQGIRLRPTDLVCSSSPGGVTNVLVNKLPNQMLQMLGDTVCSNSDLVRVTLLSSEVWVRYQAFLGNLVLGNPVLGTGNPLVLDLPTNAFPLGNSTVRIQASVSGCVTFMSPSVANIRVNAAPTINISLAIDHSVVCEKGENVTLRAYGAGKDDLCRLYYDNQLKQSKTGKEGDTYLDFMIPSDSLHIGPNKLTVRTSVNGPCGLTTVESSISVNVNPISNEPFKLKQDTIWVQKKDTQTTLVLESSIPGAAYDLINLDMNTIRMSIRGAKVDSIPIPFDLFPFDTNYIQISSDNIGCGLGTYADTAVVIVRPDLVNSLEADKSSRFSKIGPNPLSNTLHVSLAKTGDYQLRIRNALGTLIHEEHLSSSETTIACPWPSGSYFLEIEGEGTKETRKLMK